MGLLNTFELDWDKLKKQGEQNGKYTPELLEKGAKAEKKHGTKIVLNKIKRKSAFHAEQLAYSLSKY